MLETKNQNYIDLVKQFASNLDIKTIIELGSRDLLDGIALRQTFDAQVYSFDGNPVALDRMTKNLSLVQKDKINIIPFAINTYDGECNFYCVDDTPISDIGGSSLLEFDEHSQVRFPQTKIRVKCIKLDTFCHSFKIDRIDLIWSDLQGFDAKAINTLGVLLDTVKLIFCEVEYRTVYKGSVLFPEVVEMFSRHGLKLLWNDISRFNDSYGNCLFKKL